MLSFSKRRDGRSGRGFHHRSVISDRRRPTRRGRWRWTLPRAAGPPSAGRALFQPFSSLKEKERSPLLTRALRGSSLLVAALLVLVLAFGAQAAPLKVGITQIVEHPSLDAARQGFIDRMAELGYAEGADVTYDIQSAQ